MGDSGSSIFSAFPLGTLLTSDSSESIRRSCKQLDGSSTSAFSSLLGACLAAVSSGAAKDASLAAHPCLSQLPPSDAAASVQALLALVQDFARCGVAAGSVRSALEDSGLSSAKVEAFATLYAAAYSDLRQTLSAAPTGCEWALLAALLPPLAQHTSALPSLTPPLFSHFSPTHTGAGAPPPRLLDVTWRLDFLVSSKELGRVARPTYRVRFVLQDAQGQRSVEVACSPQELEDLQARLHTAVQTAEALLASTSSQ